jgi:alcohol dehydrogenase
MKAAVYEAFAGLIRIENVPEPKPKNHGVVIRVKATGLCLSDWHGWMGHDPGIRLPHVPGHEMAGVIEETGRDVTRWEVGDRVTLPFVCGCGTCPQCISGNQQICDYQFQPGFTHWGSFAEFVAVERADVNLVRLPDDMDFVSATGLGCRFITSFRAIVDQGRVSAGQWVAVHGCGGIGLSAIMIAKALGAKVVAIDKTDKKLDFAHLIGADAVVNVSKVADVVGAVVDITAGGAHVSMDALGSQETCFNSISNLRKRGVHLQVGLMVGDYCHPALPMDLVVANELEILGSHGMQAHRYPAMMEMITVGALDPHKLVGKTISLEQVVEELPIMDRYETIGMMVINNF